MGLQGLIIWEWIYEYSLPDALLIVREIQDIFPRKELSPF